MSSEPLLECTRLRLRRPRANEVPSLPTPSSRLQGANRQGSAMHTERLRHHGMTECRCRHRVRWICKRPACITYHCQMATWWHEHRCTMEYLNEDSRGGVWHSEYLPSRRCPLLSAAYAPRWLFARPTYTCRMRACTPPHEWSASRSALPASAGRGICTQTPRRGSRHLGRVAAVSWLTLTLSCVVPGSVKRAVRTCRGPFNNP